MRMNREEFLVMQAKRRANKEDLPIIAGSQKEAEREKLGADVEAFIANGGEVETISYCKSSITDDTFRLRLH